MIRVRSQPAQWAGHLRPRVVALVGPRRVRRRALASEATNKKTPRRGERGALGGSQRRGLLVDGESSAFGLLETGVLPLPVDFPQDRAVQRGVRRLPTGAGPEALRRHRLDQFFRVQRHFGGGKDLRGGV